VRLCLTYVMFSVTLHGYFNLFVYKSVFAHQDGSWIFLSLHYFPLLSEFIFAWIIMSKKRLNLTKCATLFNLCKFSATFTWLFQFICIQRVFFAHQDGSWIFFVFHYFPLFSEFIFAHVNTDEQKRLNLN
jgi:hypothetical protein